MSAEQVSESACHNENTTDALGIVAEDYQWPAQQYLDAQFPTSPTKPEWNPLLATPTFDFEFSSDWSTADWTRYQAELHALAESQENSNKTLRDVQSYIDRLEPWTKDVTRMIQELDNTVQKLKTFLERLERPVPAQPPFFRATNAG